MASGIFAILDDISVLMDDIAAMSKIATKKTAGILGDDLAVNAEKATGFLASRELPVLWAITQGSFVNKLIILPLVFILSYYLPDVIRYVLLLGGIYLSYEGIHKIYEYFISKSHKSQPENISASNIAAPVEAEKIKSAIRTDFILSIEIVIIALSTVLNKPLVTQIATVSFVAIIATIGVYGIVALIVRMDDFGLFMIRKSIKNSITAKIGSFLIQLLPKVIKALSVIGTLALILVSGGIFLHNEVYIPEIIKELPILLQEFTSGFLYGIFSLIVIESIITVYHYFRRQMT